MDTNAQDKKVDEVGESDSVAQPGLPSEPVAAPVDAPASVESPSKEESSPAVANDVQTKASEEKVSPPSSDVPVEPALKAEPTVSAPTQPADSVVDPSVLATPTQNAVPVNEAPAVNQSEPEVAAKPSATPLLVGIVLAVSLLVSGVLVYKNVSDKSVYQTESQASRGRGSGHQQAPAAQKVDPQSVVLDQESAAVDRDVTTLDGDLAEVDEAINDQPEDLSKEE